MQLPCVQGDAVADFSRSLDLRPNAINTLRKRGVTLAQLGRNEEALLDLTRSLDLAEAESSSAFSSPAASSALTRSGPNLFTLECRADTLFELGRFDEAARDYARYLQYRPDDEEIQKKKMFAVSKVSSSSSNSPTSNQ